MALRNRVSLVVSCWLPTVREVPTFSICTPSWCGSGEIWLFHQKPGNVLQDHHSVGFCHFWPPSELHHPGNIVCQFVVNHKRDRSPEVNFSSPIPGGVFTRNIIPKDLMHSATCCDYGQVQRKVLNQTTTWNVLLRHCHVSSPLFELRLCASHLHWSRATTHTPRTFFGYVIK